MLLPSIFGENLFDDMMNFDFDKEFERMSRPLYGKHAQNMMKTDVRESEKELRAGHRPAGLFQG